MSLISSPRFTAIKEDGKNDSLVYPDCVGLRDATPISYILLESAKGCTRFYESGVHLVIHGNIAHSARAVEYTDCTSAEG